MSRRVIRALLVAASMGAALITQITSAAGAGEPTFTVHAGDAPAGYTINLDLYPTNDPDALVFRDTTTGADIHCTSSSFSRQKLHLGAHRTILLKAKPFGLAGCTSAVQAPPGHRQSGIELRDLSISSATSTSSHGIDALDAKIIVATTDGATCRLDVVGSAKYTLSFQYSILRYLPQNRAEGFGFDITSVLGSCAPAFALHDQVQFVGLFKFTASRPSYNPITVSSP